MNAFSEDLKDVLVAQGLGVFAGTGNSKPGIYISHFPDMPAGVITIYDLPGPAAEGCFNPLAPRWISSMFEVMVRASNYKDAYALAWRLSSLLEKHPELFQDCPGTLRSIKITIPPHQFHTDGYRRSIVMFMGTAYRVEDDEFGPTPTGDPTATPSP